MSRITIRSRASWALVAISGLISVGGCNSSLSGADGGASDLGKSSAGDMGGPATVNLNQGNNEFSGAWFAQVNDGGLDPIPDGGLTPKAPGYDLPDGGAGPNVDPPYGVFQNSLNLWTKVAAPPYYGAASTLLKRVFDVTPKTNGAITLVAKFRWRYLLSDAVHPQMAFGLTSKAGDSMILQIFGAGSTLHTRFGLKMTDALKIGTWYSVAITIGGGAANRTVSAQISDDSNNVVWQSCDGTAGDPCPPADVNLSIWDSFQISIAIDDTSAGEANIQLQDVFVQQDPP